jgi:hypothetical protein
MGTIFNQIPRSNMIDLQIKCDPDVLFKITKKEADFVLKLPRRLQAEFEDYQKLKYKFQCLSKSYPKMGSIGTYNPFDSSSPENQRIINSNRFI